MRRARSAPDVRGTWIDSDVRRLLGVFGPHAKIYNVYSAGDSGEGCEVIEFTTRTVEGLVAWTARVRVDGEQAVTVCTIGW